MDIAADPYFKHNLSLATCASLTKHNKLESPRNIRILLNRIIAIE